MRIFMRLIFLDTLTQSFKNSAREDACAIWYTAPDFCCAVACDEIHVSNFTASIVRVMMVSDFLGEDQNADI